MGDIDADIRLLSISEILRTRKMQHEKELLMKSKSVLYKKGLYQECLKVQESLEALKRSYNAPYQT